MRVLWRCKVPQAEVMLVTVQRENIRPSKKEMTKAVTMLIIKPNCRCLQLGYESLRLLITDQQEFLRPPACFVLLLHCIKDVYTPQGLTRDLWTVATTVTVYEVVLPTASHTLQPLLIYCASQSEF
jgi:hypothetical protein